MKALMKTAFALFAIGSLAIAADKPNFSGDWKMDPEKSTFGPMPPPASMTRKVEHNDPALTVTTSQSGPQGDQTITAKYSTDSKETTNDLMGNTVKSTATWEGDALVIASKADIGGNEVKITSKWTLSANGKVLTDALHLTTPQGEIDITTVMNKQ